MILNPGSAINISALPKTHCFGCSACESICPVNCIQMAADREGFAYPQVDEAICIECHQCIDVCPGFNNIGREAYHPQPQFYGGYLEDARIRTDSSSGGFFTVLADQVLSQGGIAYGAEIDYERMAVSHHRAICMAELAPMRKSKYVQSDVSGVFAQVKKDLEAGLPVLFSGTPCQVGGLTHFLKGQPKNLLTIDLVCHGVPSPGLFASHFTLQRKALGAPITAIDFRTKEKGWGGFLNFYLKIRTHRNSKLIYAPLDAYYALFLANLSLRPVCYRCKYACTSRVGDVTLGDFWGVQKEHPDLFDGRGTSLVLVNTDKGQQALKMVQHRLTLKTLDEVRPLPPNLVHPTPKPALKDKLNQSIQFDRWAGQRVWIHLLALAVLGWNKVKQIIKTLIHQK